MKCSNCGMDLEDDALFCPYCGSKMEEPSGTAEAPQGEEASADESQVAPAAEEASVAPEEKPASASVVEEAEATPVEEPVIPSVAEEPATAPAEDPGVTPAFEQTGAASMFCPNCGFANPADAFVCGNCGTPLGGNAAQSEGMYSTVSDAPAFDGSEPTAKPKKKKTGAIVIGIVLALLVVAVVVLLVLFGNKLFSGKKETEQEAKYLTYVKDGSAYQMDKDKKKAFELAEVDRDMENEYIYQSTWIWNSAEDNSSYVFTEDGKGLYFISDSDLYYKNLKKTDTEAERIDKDVSRFYLVGSDTLIYIKGDERRLYVSKDGEAEKIDKEVSGYIRISEDEKSAFYTKQNDDETTDYYYLNLKDLSTERFIKNMDEYTYLDENHIVYIEDGKLYLVTDRTEEEKICSDCMDFSTYYDSNGDLQILYITSEGMGSVPLYDFVNDDLAAEDAKIEEPDIEDYTTIEQVEDWWGDLYDREVTDYDAYYDAMDRFYEKSDRDYYRDYLKEDSFELSEGTLYSYNSKDGSNTELMTAYFQGDISGRLISYVDPEELPSYKFSELLENGEIWDLYYKVTEDLGSYSKYSLVGDGKSVELDIDQDDYSNASTYSYGDSHKAVLKLQQREEDDDSNSLYTLAYINLDGKSMGEYTVIDTDVHSVYYRELDDQGKNLYYLKDYDDGTGDLYKDGEKIVKNASRFLEVINGKVLYIGEVDYEHNEMELYLDGERIARDVAISVGVGSSGYCYYVTDKGDIYYASDLDLDDGVYNFNINCYDGKEATTIAEDVASLVIMDDNHMFYLTDYSKRRFKGTLMFYNGKKATQVDEDVVAIMAYY